MELELNANYPCVRLYHWFIRNSGIGVATITNIPKSSLPTVFHGLASFENYHGHENSKGPEVTKFSTHPRDPDVVESIKERLEYRTIFDRWNIYILFVFFSNGGYVVANVGIGYRNFEKIELNFSDPKEEYFSRRLSSSNLRLNKLDIAPTRLFSEIHRIMLRVSL